MPSARERVNAGIRADNYAVSAANLRLLDSYALIISVSGVHYLGVAKTRVRRGGVNDEDHN